jgi:hypothetical protein
MRNEFEENIVDWFMDTFVTTLEGGVDCESDRRRRQAAEIFVAARACSAPGGQAATAVAIALFQL